MEAMPASPVVAAGSTQPAATTALTGQDSLTAKALGGGSGIEEIADDEEKVSVAGMLISQASMGSDVRFDKVAALRRTIDAGNFAVPAESVARKLMDQILKP